MIPPIPSLSHPVLSGTIISFTGKHYEILGAACRLFDRETLPHPCCVVGDWKGKRWSYRGGWRRSVGRRLVPDKDAKKHPTYWVKDLSNNQLFIKTFWCIFLSKQERGWWIKNQKSS